MRAELWRGVVYINVLLAIILCATAVAAPLQAAAPVFTLGPGDVVLVTVWKDEALTREVLVRPDGIFSFPLIGEVRAAGRGVDDVRKDVEARIREFVPDAPVTVILTELESSVVYVVGKVNKPGEYKMFRPIRVLDALAMAGGLTPFADNDEILVLRNRGATQQALPFDYDEVSLGEGLEQNILLEPGDTIVIP